MLHAEGREATGDLHRTSVSCLNLAPCFDKQMALHAPAIQEQHGLLYLSCIDRLAIAKLRATDHKVRAGHLCSCIHSGSLGMGHFECGLLFAVTEARIPDATLAMNTR